jgi:hypothetical protein
MILSLSNILKIVIDESILLLSNNWQAMSSTKQTTNKSINQGLRGKFLLGLPTKPLDYEGKGGIFGDK